jgi:hypothetical protein
MNKYSCFLYNFKDDLIQEENEENENEENKNGKNENKNEENENKNEENKNEENENKKIKKNKKKYNYKFVSKNFFSENEILISKLISQMINYKKYFHIPSKIENINYVNIENENINDYETEYDINLKYRKKIPSNNILFKYNNIEIIYLNDYLFSNHLFFCNPFSQKKYIFYKIINIYEKLLKSVNMLNQNFIFFNNLNYENIFINQNKSDLPILNDFSQSINIKSTSIQQNLKKYIFFQPPIELQALTYIFENELSSLSNNNINVIVSNAIENNYIFDNFSNNIKQKYYNDGFSFLEKFINKKVDEIISGIILYFKSWDNYALSILYLEIIIKIYKSIANKNNKFILNFMKLLLKNISFHPEKRLSLKNTRREFNQIINNISSNELKEIIDALSNTHD